MKTTIQWQANVSREPNNYWTVLFQGDICHLVEDIQARYSWWCGKRYNLSDSKLKPSTLYWKKKQKKKTNIENHSYTGGNRTPTGRSLKGPQNI